jgi:hypothetical protein
MACNRGGAEREGDGDESDGGPASGNLAVMPRPQTRKEQRPGRYRQQNAEERQRPRPEQDRTVEMRRRAS